MEPIFCKYWSMQQGTTTILLRNLPRSFLEWFGSIFCFISFPTLLGRGLFSLHKAHLARLALLVPPGGISGGGPL